MSYKNSEKYSAIPPKGTLKKKRGRGFDASFGFVHQDQYQFYFVDLRMFGAIVFVLLIVGLFGSAFVFTAGRIDHAVLYVIEHFLGFLMSVILFCAAALLGHYLIKIFNENVNDSDFV